MSKSKILFIFTGSIACYKAVNVVSKLVQEGHQVKCVLTKAAAKFIGKASLEGLTNHRVYDDLFEEGSAMGHIKLIREADLVVVAPATANYINKISCGIADDLASTLFLAHDFKKPFVIVPAMNSSMYGHPTTQASLKRLNEMGVHVTETKSGILACGETGYGKLLDPEIIFQQIQKYLNFQKYVNSGAGTDLSLRDTSVAIAQSNGKKILITGGGTSEKIDSVRSITNTSTGSTSIHLANFFSELGFQVTLLIAESSDAEIETGVVTKKFLTFNDLNSLLKSTMANEDFDFIFHAAAVSDYRLKETRVSGKKVSINGKINSNKNIQLILSPNFKIISKLKKYSLNKKIKIIGFKLTDSKNKKQIAESVGEIFKNKSVEFVIQNDLSHISKDKHKHHFNLWDKSKKQIASVQGITALEQVVTEKIIFGDNL